MTKHNRHSIAWDTTEGLQGLIKTDEEGNERYGTVNTKGEITLLLQYVLVSKFSKGFAKAIRTDEEGNEKHVTIDSKGEVVSFLRDE